MPTRIYDVAKKTGVDSKALLMLARELGITAAKVPSSSLDRITAEYLEEQARIRLQKAPDHKPKSALEEAKEVLGLNETTVQASALGNRETQGTNAEIPPPSAGLPDLAEQPSGNASTATKDNAPIVAKLLLKLQLGQPTSAQAPSETSKEFSSFREPGFQRFERQVRGMLEHFYPSCTLSNAVIFAPHTARFTVDQVKDGRKDDFGLELDHILHRANDGEDHLVVIECKNQLVTPLNPGVWKVEYNGTARNVQLQLKKHVSALRDYINPLGKERNLTIDVIVVSSDEATPSASELIDSHVQFHLLSFGRLQEVVRMLSPKPFRIGQSDVLGKLRLGIPLIELGHPELSNALAYVERCRRQLDAELFRAFAPTRERWAINGSAGMGKTVLLAYSLAVLATDHKIEPRGRTKSLVSFAELAKDLNLSPWSSRTVYAYALKEKQRQVLEVLFRRFVDDFASISHGELKVKKVQIALWQRKIPEECQILIIDEAHDLMPEDAALLTTWLSVNTRRYLVIACDRHQKLRLVGRDEAMIDGLNFSRKTKKLRLNYRNPFPVYAASIGLMFRWFCDDGPMVLPTKDDLENGFGFTIDSTNSDALHLSMWNDSHPANCWRHTVDLFPSCDAAFYRLRQYDLNPKDVLWVRFGDEDPRFDYETLNRFTYHNLNCFESVELADKYIKGQDFPVVVIEGFSENSDTWASPEGEQKMWQARKQLYICTSRATAFLFFISPPGSTANSELNAVMTQLSRPSVVPFGTARKWLFQLSLNREIRKMDSYLDCIEAGDSQRSEAA